MLPAMPALLAFGICWECISDGIRDLPLLEISVQSLGLEHVSGLSYPFQYFLDYFDYHLLHVGNREQLYDLHTRLDLLGLAA